MGGLCCWTRRSLRRINWFVSAVHRCIILACPQAERTCVSSSTGTSGRCRPTSFQTAQPWCVLALECARILSSHAHGFRLTQTCCTLSMARRLTRDYRATRLPGFCARSPLQARSEFISCRKTGVLKCVAPVVNTHRHQHEVSAKYLVVVSHMLQAAV